VADYTPAGGAIDGKVEKGGPLTITLERTPDILADLGRVRGDAPRPLLVGFAAQAGDPVAAAQRKRESKRVDLIVANDVTRPGSGFGVDTNEVAFVTPAGVESLPLLPKIDVARTLLDRVERLLAENVSTPALTR
jgi:phosphopantothenoylcysteine decarboxylase / phosphopantothenate---cysteine ligase